MGAPSQILRAASAPKAKSWSSTLKLPKSAFPPRPAPPATYLPAVTDDLYAWQSSAQRAAKETFVLHDGPPYANGALHIGHALNKVLKDLICRFQVTQGKRVQYIPGWDCHGLPIEVKALQALGDAEHERLGAVGVRKAARKLAEKTVKQQREGFKAWGVMGDWDNAYKTMDKAFEMRQLGIWKEMVVKGLVYRQYKPVYWSPSSATALAEAELEYDDKHQSTTAYVKFPIQELSDAVAALRGVEKSKICAVIWTTTPWTLPANTAIAVHADLDYCVVQCGESQDQLLVAKSRLEALQDIFGQELNIIADSIPGSSLAGSKYTNPLHGDNAVPQPIIHADFVSAASGSGLVHLAPGHGMDDYNVCRNIGIPATAPVDDKGCFTGDVLATQPERLQGLPVQNEGSLAVLDILRQTTGRPLLAVQPIIHKYPIDWRTKKPVIVRATEQWFADVDGIKDNALKALEKVTFVPQSGRSRLESFIRGRSQWCVSRQRAWGVPIPAIYRRDASGVTEAVMTGETIDHIMKVIEERGIHAWWTDPEDDAAWIAPGLEEGTYTRGKDTMDVWFDSGTSWTLLDPRPNDSPADVYIEGTDQHRGWFQSSLLTHVAHQSVKVETGAAPPDAQISAPYKSLITHGFILDQDGRKMSKSLGNVVAPDQIMDGSLLPPRKTKKKNKGNAGPAGKDDKPDFDGMGPDALRLWVASSDYTRDVTVGQPALQSVNNMLHKYRVTFKWLLGVLADYTPDGPTPSSQHSLIDTIALHQLSQTSHAVHKAYASYSFYHALNTVNQYIPQSLSAFYFETLKDRLYAGEAGDRKAAQAVCHRIFQELCDMLTPACPLLIEEVWSFTPAPLRNEEQGDAAKPGRRTWVPFTAPTLASDSEAQALEAKIAVLSSIDVAVKGAQEAARAEKKIGSGLESDVVLQVSADLTPQTRDLLRLMMTDQGANLLVVSDVHVTILETEKDVHAEWEYRQAFEIGVGQTGVAIVRPARAAKCPRCWRFVAPTAEVLCGRCAYATAAADAEH